MTDLIDGTFHLLVVLLHMVHELFVSHLLHWAQILRSLSVGGQELSSLTTETVAGVTGAELVIINLSTLPPFYPFNGLNECGDLAAGLEADPHDGLVVDHGDGGRR